ncbi:MAG: hypothetical protein HYY44_05055 [Deltaproteobacteria bacterium]|nr:hypothetical protein [Deltaproteobacteria bacterium]
MANELTTLEVRMYQADQVFLYYDRPPGLPANDCAGQQTDFCSHDINGDGFITFAEYDGGRGEPSAFKSYVIIEALRRSDAKVYTGGSLDGAKRKRDQELGGNTLSLLRFLGEESANKDRLWALAVDTLGLLMMLGPTPFNSETARTIWRLGGAAMILSGTYLFTQAGKVFDSRFLGVNDKIS